MRTRSLVPARRALSVSKSGSRVSGSSSAGDSVTSMPSSASTRTTASSASPDRSARSIAEVTSPIVTNPRERPSATRSVNCCVSDAALVTMVRLTATVCGTEYRFRGTQFYSFDQMFNLLAICGRTPSYVLSTAGRSSQEPLPALLQRDQVAEHLVVRGLVVLRIRPLQLRLDGGDLPARRQLPDPGEHHV